MNNELNNVTPGMNVARQCRPNGGESKPPKQTKGRPRVLCMVDLSLCPQVLDILRESVDVDYRPADRAVLLDIIGQYDAYWGHIDIKVDQEVLAQASQGSTPAREEVRGQG